MAFAEDGNLVPISLPPRISPRRYYFHVCTYIPTSVRADYVHVDHVPRSHVVATTFEDRSRESTRVQGGHSVYNRGVNSHPIRSRISDSVPQHSSLSRSLSSMLVAAAAGVLGLFLLLVICKSWWRSSATRSPLKKVIFQLHRQHQPISPRLQPISRCLDVSQVPSCNRL